MWIQEKEMYHFHRKNEYDVLWQENNWIDNTKDFINSRFERLESTPIYHRIEELLALESIMDQLSVMMESERDLYTLEMMIYEAKTMDLELRLEEYRRVYCPDRVSRKEAIWLCNKNDLPFWIDKLGYKRDLDLFKVEATGNLTRANACYLTTDSGIENIEAYWNYEGQESPSDEYLFQGKIYLKKKYNMWK